MSNALAHVVALEAQVRALETERAQARAERQTLQQRFDKLQSGLRTLIQDLEPDRLHYARTKAAIDTIQQLLQDAAEDAP